MNARGAAGRCPPTTWLGPWLLLLCLLVSGSITMEVPSQYCSEMITDRHLKMLQDLIDSQMETSCQIAFEFVDQEQLKDPVCYLKKAFFLVEDIIEDTLRFKHKTPNADTIEQLRELSVSLNEKHCFTKDYDEHDKACIRTFSETPLQLLEKIKSIFNETRNFLKKDWKIFSKNCNDSFAKCASQGHDRQRVEASDLQPSGFVFPLSSIILVLLAVGGLLLYRRKRRSHREPHTVDSPMEQPEGSPLTPDEDRQMELPV
ncbi:macrophage colony-stimulating factor 1 isoform X2 [Talpa occidentalis]|uniref:macrophage colony-stimulating factor 1 isoform X2 n=1 Tax=Talpa occidentalis TaxID=50954 RepID=UPI00188ED621|nr:macrophage colony-stimulating factor 1 isoform X2 [Talpa occidentalis]